MVYISQEEASRTIFVSNVHSQEVTDDILYELFLQAGPLEKVHVPKDKDGKSKGFGFVCFKHKVSVSYAINLMSGIQLFGQPIKLSPKSVDADKKPRRGEEDGTSTPPQGFPPQTTSYSTGGRTHGSRNIRNMFDSPPAMSAGPPPMMDNRFPPRMSNAMHERMLQEKYQNRYSPYSRHQNQGRPMPRSYSYHNSPAEDYSNSRYGAGPSSSSSSSRSSAEQRKRRTERFRE